VSAEQRGPEKFKGLPVRRHCGRKAFHEHVNYGIDGRRSRVAGIEAVLHWKRAGNVRRRRQDAHRIGSDRLRHQQTDAQAVLDRRSQRRDALAGEDDLEIAPGMIV
jgi:hypothetical protein